MPVYSAFLTFLDTCPKLDRLQSLYWNVNHNRGGSNIFFMKICSDVVFAGGRKDKAKERGQRNDAGGRERGRDSRV